MTRDNFLYMMSRPNFVPAVAVIQYRLVLFVFIRFKGYLDGKEHNDNAKSILSIIIIREIIIFNND